MSTPTLCRESAAEYSALADLVDAIQRAVDQAPAERLPEAVCQALRQHIPADRLLNARQREGNADRYCRHVLYAHPTGLFTVVGLVWRPGQFTPVHGHYTWCSYLVLQGDMQEDHFTWRRGANCAQFNGQVTRRQGDTAASQAGLEHIHRLRNAGPEVAVSIHVYGVDGARVATHVNRLAALSHGDLGQSV